MISEIEELSSMEASPFNVLIESKELSIPNQESTLYIIPSYLVLFNSSRNRGYTIPYPNITLHALTRKSETEDAHIYLQIDSKVIKKSNEEILELEIDSDDFIELKMFPKLDNDNDIDVQLDEMFELLSKCSALHPDLDQSDEEPNFEFNEINEDEATADESPFIQQLLEQVQKKQKLNEDACFDDVEEEPGL